MSEQQFVIFKINNEEYAVNIYHVNEIIEYREQTKVPNTPTYLMGIINYRGKVVSIIDLRCKFNSKSIEVTETSRIIIMNFNGYLLGFAVDEASETLTIDEKLIENDIEFIKTKDNSYITGIAKLDKRLLVILDLEKILTENEKKEIAAI